MITSGRAGGSSSWARLIRIEDAPREHLAQIGALSALLAPLAPGAQAAPQQRHGHQRRHRRQPIGHCPDAASGEQSGGQKRARDRHAGAHLATTPQRPGHQQGPTAQEEPRQGRWQRLEAQRLHHRGPDQQRRKPGQRAGGEAGATGATGVAGAGTTKGESPSSRSITGRVSIGVSKPLSSRPPARTPSPCRAWHR